MSNNGLKAALQFGEKLDSFDNLTEAENYFGSYRENQINALAELCTNENFKFSMDYTVDSLKEIEKLYFVLCESDGFLELNISRVEFEQMLAMYWSEVVIKNNPDVKWVVEKYPFVETKYELLLNRGLMNLGIVNMFANLKDMPGNKRKDLLYREYNRYFKD